MPTEIDPPKLQRRQWLTYAALLGATTLCATASAAAGTKKNRLAAAWQGAHGYQLGVLVPRGSLLQIESALDVPTRAHGVWVEQGGTLLAVARRPGDWLLRWHPGSQAVAWAWIEIDRAFNGHVLASTDGRTLYTSETNLETGQGLIGLRNAASLEKIDEWSTHGMDPHELLLDADGSLLVANGGIPALPETGRNKLSLNRMDSSLVRLDTVSGELRGQWRLADKRLSLRHMAWGPPVAQNNAAGQRVLGIALQAEHEDARIKLGAPVLAVFDGHQLQACAAGSSQSLAGYGGDIAGMADGFAVSCPRANGVATWRADGQWRGFLALQEACALASSSVERSHVWAGGRSQALLCEGEGETIAFALQSVRLDNHWAEIKR